MTDRVRVRLLLADDHALVREGLKRLIDDQPDMKVVAEAGEGLLAVRLAQDVGPDLALVDVSMPGLDGTQVTQMITAACPHVKVIALTRHDDAGFVQRLLAAGAAGYVLKQSVSTELTRAIRAVAAGERYLDSSLRPAAPLRPDAAAAAVASVEPADLTPEEEEVLRLLASGHSNQEIATNLSKEIAEVLELRATAMSKAGLASRGAVIRYADRRGWLQ